MPSLILLRHGQSEWNLQARFTGWTDVGLTEAGVGEAVSAGRAMRRAGIDVAVSHTSLLRRAVRTAELALDQMDLSWLPVKRHWRLNERHYGALQGHTHAEMTERHGADAVKTWRRSYDVRPPLLEPQDQRYPSHDPRYASVAPEVLPAGECLADVVARMLPYYYDAIVPDMMRLGSVLVTAHGNSIRAMIKHLDRISDADIPALEIPTGVPILYTFDDSMSVRSKELLTDA